MGKRNYFTGYGIPLHEFPVVAVLFTKAITQSLKLVQEMLHTVVQVLEWQNLHVVK